MSVVHRLIACNCRPLYCTATELTCLAELRASNIFTNVQTTVVQTQFTNRHVTGVGFTIKPSSNLFVIMGHTQN